MLCPSRVVAAVLSGVFGALAVHRVLDAGPVIGALFRVVALLFVSFPVLLLAGLAAVVRC